MNKENIGMKEFLGIARLMEFEIDQWAAISNKEEISYETYKECLDICIKIGDFETFCNLTINYPEHSKRHEEEILSESEEVCLPEEESKLLWNRIQESIQKLKE